MVFRSHKIPNTMPYVKHTKQNKNYSNNHGLGGINGCSHFDSKFQKVNRTLCRSDCFYLGALKQHIFLVKHKMNHLKTKPDM